MPLPPETDPYGTWWTLRDSDSLLHGVMFMKKQNIGAHEEPKTSQIADEHLMTSLLNQGSFNILNRLFAGESQPQKKRRVETASVKAIGTEKEADEKEKEKETVKEKKEEGDPMELEHK